MRGQARLITPEGLDMSSPFDEPISPDFLQRAVGGDIEIVSGFDTIGIADKVVPCVAFCNHLQPVNHRATRMWHAALVRSGAVEPTADDDRRGYSLVGSVVIATGDDEFLASAKAMSSDQRRHWADDPYWTEALDRYIRLRRRGRKITIDLDRVESFIYRGDVSPAYRMMEGMCSVQEHEGVEGYRGAPRLVLALLQLISEMQNLRPVRESELDIDDDEAATKMRRRNADLNAAKTKGREERKR
jgi:hypothetical protein